MTLLQWDGGRWGKMGDGGWGNGRWAGEGVIPRYRIGEFVLARKAVMWGSFGLDDGGEDEAREDGFGGLSIRSSNSTHVRDDHKGLT